MEFAVKRTETCPNCGHAVEAYRNPAPTTDVVIIRGNQVLLIRRANPPEGWALPGGFIDYGESAEAAAVREAREEIGLDVKLIRLVGVYSDPSRDPRFHTLSVVFLAEASGQPRPGDDAAEVGWFPLDHLPARLAFDHKAIVTDAVKLIDYRKS